MGVCTMRLLRVQGIQGILGGGVWLVGSLCLACLGGLSVSRADPDGGAGQAPTVRVLLFETRDRLVVRQEGVGHRIDSRDGGLSVDGGPVRKRWRAASESSPLRVRDLEVRGAIEVVAADGKLVVVNEVPLETYLAGTLGREMYGSWSPDALRAQAVASRTYAVERKRARRGEPWHLKAGTQSQVYAGVAAESASVEEAVAATRGEILSHRGGPILAAFHSSSGGRTASAEEVWGEPRAYLVSIPVEDEWESPDTYWRVPVSGPTLGRAVATLGRDIGAIRRAEVVERTGSGRAARVRLAGERGTLTVTGRSLRRALGESTVRSTLFELRETDDGFVFVGSGSGHGVGMSQWGARAMARRGMGYRAILRTFYPGATLQSLSDLAQRARAASGGDR
jgi:stage II sporulation protein D